MKKIMKNKTVQYTILFLILVAGIYLSFALYSKSFFWYIDGELQYYPYIYKLKSIFKETIQNGVFPYWSWDVGLGGDTFANFGVIILNPFQYFITLLPKSLYEIGYAISVLIQLYLVGLFMLKSMLYLGYKKNSSLIGAVLYIFTCSAYIGIIHASFNIPIMLFPLIIMGIEKVFRENKPYLLIGVVTLSAVTSLYFTYMSGLLAGVYCILRYFEIYKGQKVSFFLKKIGSFVGYALLGVAIVAPVVLNAIISLRMTNTSTSTKFGWVQTLKEYVLFVPRIISPDVEEYPYFGLAAILLIIVPIIIYRAFKKSLHARMWCICMLLILFPIGSSILNGFSYPSTRWFYVMVFFMILELADIMEHVKIPKKKLAIYVVAVAVYYFLVSYVLLKDYDVYYLLKVVVTLVFALAIIWAFSNKKLTIALVILNCIVLANFTFLPAFQDRLSLFRGNGVITEKYSSSKERVVQKINDDSFYRVDQFRNVTGFMPPSCAPGESYVWGARTITEYSSQTSSLWQKLNEYVENNMGCYQRTAVTGNDNRCRLDFLMGVKYFLGDDSKNPAKVNNQEKYKGYLFDEKMSVSGVDVYKSQKNIGLGCGYSKFILKSDWLKLNPLEREQAMMQAVVVEDGSKLPLNRLIKLTDKTVKKDCIDGKAMIERQKYCKLENNSISATNTKSQIVLSAQKISNCEVYVVIKNLKCKKLYGKDEKENKDGSSKPFEVYCSTRGLSKKIASRNDTNQGIVTNDDYYVNMGDYDEFDSDIYLSFAHRGLYTYDSIEVVGVPYTDFDLQADELIKSGFQCNQFDNSKVVGECSLEQDSILYLSIPKMPGWSAYVDGKKADTIETANIAFTGVYVPKGCHKIELSYSPWGLKAALVISGLSILFLVLYCIWKFRANKRSSLQPGEEKSPQ